MPSLAQMVEAYESDRLSVDVFRTLASVSSPERFTTESLIMAIWKLLEKHEKLATEIVLQITHARYCFTETVFLPEDVIMKILTDQTILEELVLGHGQGDWYWHEIAQRYLERNPEGKLELFQKIVEQLRNMRHSYFGINDTLRSVLADIIDADPAQCWRILTSDYGTTNDGLDYEIRGLLRPDISFVEDDLTGLISHFPLEDVREWISKKQEERAPLIAAALSKTLDPKTPAGKFARIFWSFTAI